MTNLQSASQEAVMSMDGCGKAGLGCVGGGRRLAERGASGSLGRTPAAPQRPKGHSRSQGQCQDCQPAGLGAGGSGSTSLVWVCVSDTGLPGTPPCGSRATEIWVKG